MTEELKSQLDYFIDEPIYLRKVIDELKQENRELKAYKDVNEDFKKAWDELKQENERLKDKADHFEMANDIKKQDIDSLRNTNEQLRLALEDIKSILQTDTCLNIQGSAIPAVYIKTKEERVLDKINEVLSV